MFLRQDNRALRIAAPSESLFPGDPGDGNYYVAYAAGGGSGGRGTFAYGQSISQNKLGLWHTYADNAPAETGDGQYALEFDLIDDAIADDVIPSQSFKLASHDGADLTNGPIRILNGELDAIIDADAAGCIARAPWPIVLCFFHEPGGDFTTDTMRTNYRAAYRYIVQRYRDAGVTNVCWTNIQEAPYDFRPTPDFPAPPGGGRGVDWRKFHPDWNGGTTNTIADWYTGDDQMMDIFGLDIYNPLVGGTSNQPYADIWRDVEYRFAESAFPIDSYGGVGIFEMGWSDVIAPDPNWIAYAATVLTEQVQHNIKIFTYWNNNNDVPPRYDMAEAGNASDVDGDKYAGWNDIVDGAITFTPPS